MNYGRRWKVRPNPDKIEQLRVQLARMTGKDTSGMCPEDLSAFITATKVNCTPLLKQDLLIPATDDVFGGAGE